MAWHHDFRKRVDFAETDMAGIVHMTNFFRYMETAEYGFFRDMGFSFYGELEGTLHAWPRVHVACDFRHPLRFEDELECRLLVAAVKPKAIEYVHVIRRIDPAPAEVVAIGRVVTVCCRIDPQTKAFRSTPIPETLRRHLEVAPAEQLALAE